VVVLGDTLARELFGNRPALGQWVRIADRRFRVIGTLASTGLSLGVDLGDLALVPVASAQALFDTPALFRILVQARGRGALEPARERVLEIIRERHEGEDDVTIITQDAMLATFDKILNALTLAVSGIAAISLMVAGVLIMNVMLVAVAQRTGEIGLLKALGAAERQILGLFLTEALLLAGAGTLAGLATAGGGVYLFNAQVDAFQLVVPLWAPVAAAGVALATGLLFGLLPALRAARLDPVAALAGR
jgi:putative ABC transport system permease protein